VSTANAVARKGCAEETELAAAARLQRALLPPSPFVYREWSLAHHFAPAGAVGGDILDLIPAVDRLYFVFADVSGKGIGASLVTAYLHAIFRSLVPTGLSVEGRISRAPRETILQGSTPASGGGTLRARPSSPSCSPSTVLTAEPSMARESNGSPERSFSRRGRLTPMSAQPNGLRGGSKLTSLRQSTQ
jgi:hypothetical protein